MDVTLFFNGLVSETLSRVSARVSGARPSGFAPVPTAASNASLESTPANLTERIKTGWNQLASKMGGAGGSRSGAYESNAPFDKLDDEDDNGGFHESMAMEQLNRDRRSNP
jgi:hypothetical protein